ncbi:ATP-binding cassette domain-containing protein [Paenibacillus sp. LMG 31456]|uniref:ATP-binding cassette domain-containing protein n=1 Tax=Paenibacillus foliorum TaxID=2654974 RepID=A0A972GWZ6_9BACL|nr:ABC transporter ATP-binding protein [Paenibacillus foliorum]NOU97843.1 ATP-binding cassette domain-containing protein [Paenibacillus foliorum]
MNEALLKVEHLTVGYANENENVRILENVSFSVGQGEIVGIVGESGCGKSLTSLSVMGLLAEPLQIQTGSINFNGTDLTRLGKKELNRYRGKEIAMIFQEPMTSLNPVFTIGNQISEAMTTHLNMNKKEVLERTVYLLKQVGIPSAEHRVHEYPHQLSGGMRQRAMIAMALACDPLLLIADEPTTALDVTIQAQILDLLLDIQREKNMSLIFITHDLGVLFKMADRVMVMYGGRIIESAPMKKLYDNPLHPYTQGLWKAVPSSTKGKGRLYNIPGTVPDPKDNTKGCRFASRCEFVEKRCLESEPPLLKKAEDWQVACFLHDE